MRRIQSHTTTQTTSDANQQGQSLLEAFRVKNQELVDKTSSSTTRDIYLTNVVIVARHRLELASEPGMNGTKLEKLCSRGTLADLVQQAEVELERVSQYISKKSLERK